MPPATLPFPRRLKQLDLQRKRDYAATHAWYEGKQWTGARRPNERRLTLNYARRIIDRSAALILRNRTIHIHPPIEAPEDAAARATAAWQAIEEDQQLHTLDLETEIDCAVLGDACYKVTWDPRGGRVRITSPDTQGLYAWWDPDDLNTITQVATQYQETDTAGRRVTCTERWTPEQYEIWQDDVLLEAAAVEFVRDRRRP